MADCGWQICWPQCCRVEWPMVTVGYVLDYEHGCLVMMEIWMHRKGMMSPDWVSHPAPSLHVAAWYCTEPCSWICKPFLEDQSIPVFAWPADSLDMSASDRSSSVYKTARSGSCQYPVTLLNHWKGAGQRSKGNNRQPDELDTKETCCKWWWTQILTGFVIPHPLNTVFRVWHFILGHLTTVERKRPFL